MTGPGGLSVIIVGGGASGIILALHLLRSSDPRLRVSIVEKRSAFGQGRAYSATLPEHVLNVNAMRMSAFADEPDDFVRWLRGRMTLDDPSAFFAPRSLYGEYLQDLLGGLVEREGPAGRLQLVRQECVAISSLTAGVEVKLADGTSLVGQIAVLAAGHDEAPAPEQSFAVRIDSAEDTPLDPDAAVLILGTGLSMVDALLALRHRGHRGVIHALSRRGLLPQPHRKGTPIRLDRADVPLGTSVGYFIRWLRDLVRTTERAGGDWRDVIDGLRPFNQLIWRSWPADARQRFLRHAKAWWDIHRHRIAPAIYEKVADAIRGGQLKPIAGRIEAVKTNKDWFDVSILARRAGRAVSLRVARIYDCTGVVKDVSTGSIAVIRWLTDRGLSRPDALRLGLDVTEDCAVIDAQGVASDRLFAVGPLTRGTFFEIEAIPEIRRQCDDLAKRLAP